MPARSTHDEKASGVNGKAAVLRSLLFVPGDSERKQAKALASEADALILDLEDSVAPPQLPAARARVKELLLAPRKARPQLWVRVNSPSSGQMQADLEAVLPGQPAGIMLPKVTPREALAACEIIAKLEPAGQSHKTLVIPIATETPAAVFSIAEYGALDFGGRLAGLTWGMEDLAAVIGAGAKRTAEGALTPPFALARTVCVLAAAGAGVQAIDGIHADFRDAAGLAAELEQARRDGFTAKMAIHPDQVAAINAAFTPTRQEIEQARRIVAAFAEAGGAGVTSLDGRMLDRPHLIHAQRILQRADEFEAGS